MVLETQIQHLYARVCRICQLLNGIMRELRGEAAVVEFAYADDALSASLVIHAVNALMDNTRLGPINPGIRSGISFGQVIGDGNLLIGEPVIRAQRIEQLAELDMLVFDQMVFVQLEVSPNIEIQVRGRKQLKGFEQPMMTYQAQRKHDDPIAGLQVPLRSLICCNAGRGNAVRPDQVVRARRF